MSTSYYLLCDEHKEVLRVSYHRAVPPRVSHYPDAGEMAAQFCYRHLGCPLRVVSEHAGEPWDYKEYEWQEPDETGHIPFARSYLEQLAAIGITGPRTRPPDIP